MVSVNFQVQAYLTFKNTFKQTDELGEGDCIFDVNIHFRSAEDAWYEFKDLRYCELGDVGGLWFKGKSLYGYDGNYELPSFILDMLEVLGYDVSKHR